MQKNKIKQFLANIIYRRLSTPFSNDIVQNHILSQDVLDNRRAQLCKHIISSYIKIVSRSQKKSNKNDYIHQRFTTYFI